MTIDSAQSDIVTTVLPALQSILAHLDVAVADTSHLPFVITDNSGATVATIDVGDIPLLKGVVALVAGALELGVAYHVDPGSFNLESISDSNENGLLEPSEYCASAPFFQRYKQNAWAQMPADLQAAVAAIKAAGQAGLHGGSATDPISPNNAEIWAGVTEAVGYAAQVEPATAGPVTVDGLVVNLTAWASGPPDDLRNVLPTIAVDSDEEATLPGPTVGGLFPNQIDPMQAASAIEDLLTGLYQVYPPAAPG